MLSDKEVLKPYFKTLYMSDKAFCVSDKNGFIEIKHYSKTIYL